MMATPAELERIHRRRNYCPVCGKPRVFVALHKACREEVRDRALKALRARMAMENTNGQ